MEYYKIVLFKSVNHAIKAEKILKKRGLKCRLIPVPKEISTSCGVCIRILDCDSEIAENALKDRIEEFHVCDLPNR